MTSLTRAPRPVAAAIVIAASAVGLIAGCQSSSSSSSAAVPAATRGAVVNPGGPMQPAGSAVYLSEGGDVRGAAVHEPGCAAGCPLSGDGTAELSAMTWSTWTGTEAVGSGTEKLDGCTPDCASGKLYAVKVTVTFTKPVHVCAAGVSHWYWTQASFAWPDGLPAALKGANAPANPFIFSDIASQSTSCG